MLVQDHKRIFWKEIAAKAAYLGSTFMWPKKIDKNKYQNHFYVENNSDDTFNLVLSSSGSVSAPDWIVNFEYSNNKVDWTTFGTINDTNLSFTYTMQPHERLYLRADAIHGLACEKNTTVNRRSINLIVPDTIGGNIMSLLYKDNFVDKTSYSYIADTQVLDRFHTRAGFGPLFAGSTTLKDAGNLALPIISCHEHDYGSMFSGCTSLVNAPSMDVMFTSSYCCSSMFNGCTSLKNAPELNPVSLSSHCYEYMFRNCSSLEKTPKLKAASLPSYCYSGMFQGCTTLTEVRCYAESGIDTYDSTTGWLENVSPTGNFIKKAGANWPTGTYGIPNNWTVYEQ